MMLTGTYERNLDAKGRLSLPAAVRNELGEHVRVLPAPDVEALYVFSESEYGNWVDSLFEKRGGFNPRSPEDQNLRRMLNAMAAPMDIDSASRIGLSDTLRASKHLSREVTVVGNADHLEVWDRATWNARLAESQDKLMALFFS